MMDFDKKRNIMFYAVCVIALLLCLSIFVHYQTQSRMTPQQKVLALANEIRHNNPTASAVLFTLSRSMLYGDEGRLAIMMALYAVHMKNSLEALP